MAQESEGPLALTTLARINDPPRDLLPASGVTPEDQFRYLLQDLALVHRGVVLAYQRERVPSYAMELKAVLETVELMDQRARILFRRLMDEQPRTPASPGAAGPTHAGRGPVPPAEPQV